MNLTHAMFSPEKDHPAQLRAFHRVLADHPEYAKPGPLQVRLVMMGGSRNAEDAARIDALRELARELGIEVRTLPLYPRICRSRTTTDPTGACRDNYQCLVSPDAQLAVKSKHRSKHNGG